MRVPTFTISDKARRYVIGMPLILAALLTLFLMLPAQPTSASSENDTSASYVNEYGEANVITSGFYATTNGLGEAVDAAQHSIYTSRKSFIAGVTQTSKTTVHGVNTASAFTWNLTISSVSWTFGVMNTGINWTAHAVGSSFLWTARTVGSGVTWTARSAATIVSESARMATNVTLYTVRLPSNIFGRMADASVVNAIIRPADKTPVPTIDPIKPDATNKYANISAVEFTAAEQPAPQPSAAPIPQSTDAPIWPIHGAITTLFGVPHWPYQPTHTGLDISDGKASGVTPIHAFKPGRVVETVTSRVSLGNHVVIDHGDGLTSVYGHMSSIAVQVGQIVDQNTVVGMEGSTGASTGTHLHFEIRINGTPVNPLQFVAGRP